MILPKPRKPGKKREMFKIGYITEKIKDTLHLHRRWPRKKIVLNVIIAIIVLGLLWTISALGQLRTFIPDYFKLVGTIFDNRTYLILFQNNYELRPNGGFISAYGVLEIKRGFPADISFYDVYGEIDEHDYVDPPHYPMNELLWSETYGGYTFRDANYYANFPDSTEELIDFYQITNPDAEIDGILTVDFSTLEDLIGLYEPISAGEYELTNENLFETLEAEVSDIDRHSEEELDSRKDIMRDIMRNLVKNIALNPWKARLLSDTLVKNLNEKHILMWFDNDYLEEKVTALGWGGVMPDPVSDILAVSEANLGGMKNDRYIARNISYEVDIQVNQIICNLEIDIDHYGGTNIPLSGDYKGYFRAFVHPEAELISSSTNETYEEFYDDYKAFGDIVRLDATGGTTLSYTYSLPLDIFEGTSYNLDLIKQPGTDADHYEIIVHTPQGVTLASDEFETKEEHAYLSIDLEEDQFLSLDIHADETSPRIHSHEIVELNKIWIGFNEDLDCATASDPFGYTIVDTDRTNDHHDTVTIDTITCDGGHIWLDTIGMTEQNEEFYEITLRNMRDKSGNYIDPNPRTITVVQRYL